MFSGYAISVNIAKTVEAVGGIVDDTVIRAPRAVGFVGASAFIVDASGLTASHRWRFVSRATQTRALDVGQATVFHVGLIATVSTDAGAATLARMAGVRWHADHRVSGNTRAGPVYSLCASCERKYSDHQRNAN